MIFQDPISSLNPRRRVEDIVAEGLRIWKIGDDKAQAGEGRRGARRRAGSIPTVARGRRPHQFSGGQCQRISIARALVTEPKLIICDEPVSALDVSVQAQILNLLEDMKARYGLTLIFIAHDLAVVKNVSDRVVVMYLGKICEVGPPDELYERPAHPYTAALLAAIPVARPVDPAGGPARARRRDPVAGRAAERLPLPHPLPAGAGRLRAAGTADPGDRDRVSIVACHFPLGPGRVAADRSDRQQRLGAGGLTPTAARLGARLGRLAAGLLAVALLLFALPARLPGGTETAFLGSHATDPVARAALRDDLHLDRAPPVAVRRTSSATRSAAISGTRRSAASTSARWSASARSRACCSRRRRRRRVRSSRRAADAGGAARSERRRRAGPERRSRCGVGAAAVRRGRRRGALRRRSRAGPARRGRVARSARACFPRAALGVALAIWTTDRAPDDARHRRRGARRHARDRGRVRPARARLAARRRARRRPDPLMLRGALLAVSVVAVVAGVVFVPVGSSADRRPVAPTIRRRAPRAARSRRSWVARARGRDASRGCTSVSRPRRGSARRVAHGRRRRRIRSAPTCSAATCSRAVLATARGSLLLVVAADRDRDGHRHGDRCRRRRSPAAGVERARRRGARGMGRVPGRARRARAAGVQRPRREARPRIALAFVAAPGIALRRAAADARRAAARPTSTLGPGAWLGSVGSQASSELVRATLATMFVGASRVVVAEIVAGLLGLGPAATQTWSHEIVDASSRSPRTRRCGGARAGRRSRSSPRSRSPGLGNAIRPAGATASRRR